MAMFHISGRLISKSLLREGTNKHGTWQLVEFVIQKQYKKKKTKIAFVAFGKVARFVQECPLKERIKVHFYPKCDKYKDKYYTELKAEEVEKWVSKRQIENRAFINNEELDREEFLIQPDLQLFTKEEIDVQDKNDQEGT